MRAYSRAALLRPYECIAQRCFGGSAHTIVLRGYAVGWNDTETDPGRGSAAGRQERAMTDFQHDDQVHPARPAADAPDARPVKPVTRSRLGGLWIALTSGAVVLLLLLIFILENGQRADIAYFGAHGRLPLGVALLLAAVLGILLVVIPGAGRMLQLRMAARRQGRRAETPAPHTIPADPQVPTPKPQQTEPMPTTTPRP
jgi:uncharacterized integral membrane protein